MSYAEQHNVQLVDNGTAASTGVKGSYFAALMPYTVRVFAVSLKADPSGAAVITLKKRPTPGSASGESVIATINVAAGHNAGDTVYKADLNTAIGSDEEVVVDVTTLHASLTSFNASMLIDPDWDSPANLTSTTTLATA